MEVVKQRRVLSLVVALVVVLLAELPLCGVPEAAFAEDDEVSTVEEATEEEEEESEVDDESDESDDDEEADDESDENILTNSIESTTRTVAQDGSALTATDVDGVDTYTVESKTGLTVTYSNSMDMTVLAASFLSTIQSYFPSITDAWTALQTFYYWITDETVIYLTYQFNDAVDLSTLDSDDLATLASQITLTSDMFTFSQTASDLSVDTEKNALVITCHWSSANAAAAMNSSGSLSPTITITGITLDLVSDWGTTTAEDGTTTENDSLTVVANGSVAGTMAANVTIGTNSLYSGTASIDGGAATDTFVLVMAADEEETTAATTEGEEEALAQTGDASATAAVALATGAVLVAAGEALRRRATKQSN